MPFIGFTLNSNRDIVESGFDFERFESQFILETDYVLLLYTLIIGSLFAFYFLMEKKPSKKCFKILLIFVSLSFFPLICLFFPIIWTKDSNYIPSFFMHMKHMTMRYT